MDIEKLIMYLILIILFFPPCISLDTLTSDQSIKDGQSLISNKNNFILGFFSPGNSSYRYLGIWYAKVKKQTLVWVANRNDPISDSTGVLTINQSGNLVLHDSHNHLLWSTNVSVQGTTSSVAQLQDSGNLVLVQDNNKMLLWQSFDYPTDTLLPDMKIGLNRITGLNSFLTSWKSEDDPGTGDFSLKLNLTGFPQLLLYECSTPCYRASPWPWNRPAFIPSLGFNSNFVNNEDEISSFFSLNDPSIIIRFLVDSSGLYQQLTWNDGDRQWKQVWSTPRSCDNYGSCGAYGICIVDSTSRFMCTCLPGYEPKSLRDRSEGCVRKKLGLSMCGNGEGFVKVAHLKTPDTFDAAWMDMSMSSLECEQACLRNCSCTAFINYNTNGKGFGCLSFYGELIDILEFTEDGWDLNVRVDVTELGSLLF